MITLREQIAHQAMDWVHTPYVHKARVKGIGVDCAQLVGGIALDLGLVTSKQLDDIPPYDVEYHLHNRDEKLLQILEQFGCVKKEEMQIGDILAFRYGRSCSHLGIVVDFNQIVHAKYDMKNPKVVINTLVPDLLRRVGAIYSFPGVK